jgi:hypothetical protein
MNFIELYKLCKPYVEFVEKNKKTIENLTRIDEAEDIEELLILSDEIEVSFKRDLKIFDEAFRLQTDIELPIREEVVTELIRSNIRYKKASESSLEDIRNNHKHEYKYSLSDTFAELLENWIDKHENQL